MGADSREVAVWGWHLSHNICIEQKQGGWSAGTHPVLHHNCCHSVLFLGQLQQHVEEQWMSGKKLCHPSASLLP